MNWMIFPALALVASIPAFGQGYDLTKWGMTEDEVRAAYPNATWTTNKRDGQPYPDHQIRQTTSIAGVTCDVLFKFVGGKLADVNVTPVDTSYSSSARSTLAAALESKYGLPHARSSFGVKWLLDGVMVETATFIGPKASIFIVTYRPRQSSPGL